MEEYRNEAPRPVNPRRRRKTKLDVFKEAYLPLLIILAALALIVVFIVGAVNRPSKEPAPEKETIPVTEPTVPTVNPQLEQEMAELIAQAAEHVKDYDYQAALDILNSFSGDIRDYPELNNKIIEYEKLQKELVVWDDPGKVVHLSFQILIADTQRAMKHSSSANLNKNYVTTGEFSAILQQLYDNGYILVDIDDIITTETAADGTTAYKAKPLYLPAGKKPLMLTQNNLSYSYYLIDSDGDYLPDAKGAGFASKLLWDGQNFTCEMVDASGNTVTGDFDLVPILEKFIANNPDFSYRGARANLALTGHNGLLGYRTHPAYSDNEGSIPSASSIFGEAFYQKEIQDVTVVIDALKERGYTISCYTFSNVIYEYFSTSQIRENLNLWNSTAAKLLGSTDVFTFARMSDISPMGKYSNEKFNLLQSYGFRYFLGFCNDGKPWAKLENGYVLQGRIMVTGANMATNSHWFAGMFHSVSILDPDRKPISQ